MATHRRESLHAPGRVVQSGRQEAVGKGNHGESRAGQTEEGGGGGVGGGGSDEGRPTSHPRGVVPPSGVVQGGSGPLPVTCSSYAQAGHGGAGHTLQPVTSPWKHHPGHHSRTRVFVAIEAIKAKMTLFSKNPKMFIAPMATKTSKGYI